MCGTAPLRSKPSSSSPHSISHQQPDGPDSRSCLYLALCASMYSQQLPTIFRFNRRFYRGRAYRDEQSTSKNSLCAISHGAYTGEVFRSRHTTLNHDPLTYRLPAARTDPRFFFPSTCFTVLSDSGRSPLALGLPSVFTHCQAVLSSFVSLFRCPSVNSIQPELGGGCLWRSRGSEQVTVLCGLHFLRLFI